MSLARKHLARFAALQSHAADPSSGGGQTPAPVIVGVDLSSSPDETTIAFVEGGMSLARAHLMRHAARDAAIVLVDAAGEELPPAPVSNTVHVQMMARLGVDLRRLKEIQSIERKIATKAEMLPEYADYVAGLLEAAQDGKIARDELLPTIMIWRIDVGDFAGALPLIDYVLDHDVPLASRYDRQAPVLIAEEIANAAARRQSAGKPFDLAVLEHVEEATLDHDMPDQVRAKLQKAIGVELLRTAETLPVGNEATRAALQAALAPLKRAHELNDRVGVKDRIKRAEKTLAALDAAAGEGAPDGETA